MKSLSPAA
jgi:hypothetical protein